LEETKRYTGSVSADEVEPMGQEEYSMKMLIRAVWVIGRWRVADKSRRRKEVRIL